jgi:hypothetical protein
VAATPPTTVGIPFTTASPCSVRGTTRSARLLHSCALTVLLAFNEYVSPGLFSILSLLLNSVLSDYFTGIIYLLRNGEKLNRGQRSVVGVHASRHQDPVLVIQPVQRRLLKAVKATTTSKCRLFHRSRSPDICAGVIFTRHFERLSLHLPVPRFHV